VNEQEFSASIWKSNQGMFVCLSLLTRQCMNNVTLRHYLCDHYN